MGIIPVLTKKIEKWASYFPVSHYLLGIYYNKKVKREIELSDICNEDRVLCIGGGSVPCTALEIMKRTGASVDIVDLDPVAVRNSKRLIEKLDLDDKINVIQARGEEVDPRGFTVIHVALQAYPHDQILKNILFKLSEGARILLRSPKESLNKVYSTLNQVYPTGEYQCVEKEYGKGAAVLLFIDPEGGNEDEESFTIYSGNTAGISNSMAG
ncbi:class I SAM-dependent methyltransferase [Natroniella acetigena]|uniref:class I SAM-dependent methyltransferase n=1 Tax=Natroniella acetigena TaxID=52004 RepID=UPI00200B81D4|nr:class I SAM-dependent methyltransferase [Natroniella acetigena]MCK8826669.1 class I SAM-dependent methyltransferase [Natroniella acetigena]